MRPERRRRVPSRTLDSDLAVVAPRCSSQQTFQFALYSASARRTNRSAFTSMLPSARRLSGSAPSTSGSGACASGLTKTKWPQVATGSGSSRTPSASKPAAVALRAERSTPSRSYVHARYGHCSVSATALASQTSEPRWRHTLVSARACRRCRARRARGRRWRALTKSRAWATPVQARGDVLPAAAKTLSRSAASTAGSTYQLHGKVCAGTAASMPRAVGHTER